MMSVRVNSCNIFKISSQSFKGQVGMARLWLQLVDQKVDFFIVVLSFDQLFGLFNQVLIHLRVLSYYECIVD